jgi:amidohydrolase
MNLSTTKARAVAAVEAQADPLWQTALAIHRQPQLGYTEHTAARLLCDLLAAAGLQVEAGIAGMPTAFRAAVGSKVDRPAIAVLAEYDALPEVGHGCGHNLIGTAAVGAGLALQIVAAELPGAVLILGCPAEESAVDGAGGKVRLIEAGELAGVDAALMVHPGTADLIPLSPSLGSCGLEFEFIGRPAHAALAPQDGINALEGVIQTFIGVNGLRQHLGADARIHGIITQGGTAPGIVPGRAVCRFRIRAADREKLGELVKKTERCAQAGALACGAELRVREYTHRYLPTRPNPALAAAMEANLAALGRTLTPADRAIGTVSTDFGNVSQLLPAVAATVAIADAGVTFHSPEFAAAAASERARVMLLDSAKALAMTALDLLYLPALLAGARAAHV